MFVRHVQGHPPTMQLFASYQEATWNLFGEFDILDIAREGKALHS